MAHQRTNSGRSVISSCQLTNALGLISLEDFRDLNILPSSRELLRSRDRLLKPNIVSGGYESVHTYLDIQFKLLREDFFKPIKEDLANFQINSTKRYGCIKMHEIKFIRKGVKLSKFCYNLEFVSGEDAYSLSNNKRFMIGSLLIFSQDNLKHVFYGRVEDTSQVKYRRILVSLKGAEVLENVKYLMIECKEFFEPYYNVLKVLQNLQVENFPMKKYIIDVGISKTLPKYLNGVTLNINTDKLNRSQAVALKSALNREFAIIQGPPGTGKTFLGLEIAKRLLAYSHLWWNRSPLLVISYTNHALDQFLEGLLGTTEDLLRLGGRSKSQKLVGNNLYGMRRRFYNSVEGSVRKTRMAPVYREFRNVERQIRTLGIRLDNVRTCRPSMAFHFHVLTDVVDEMGGWFSDRKNDKEFIVWMLEDDGSMMMVNNNQVVSVLLY